MPPLADDSLANNDISSEKQYKTQLKKWNLDIKYIKASEYMFMIKTMRERQAANPPKETQFILRGRVVDPKDIARFEKRAQKKGTMREGDPIECDGKTPQMPNPLVGACLLTTVVVCRTRRGHGVWHTTS